MQQNLNKKQDADIESPHWVLWLVCGIFCGFWGGFFVALSTTRDVLFTGIEHDLLGLGILFFAISVIFDLLMIKDLIAEAHIVAMEVFFGKKRAVGSGVIFDSDSHDKENGAVQVKPKQRNNKARKKASSRIMIDDDD